MSEESLSEGAVGTITIGRRWITWSLNGASSSSVAFVVAQIANRNELYWVAAHIKREKTFAFAEFLSHYAANLPYHLPRDHDGRQTNSNLNARKRDSMSAPQVTLDTTTFHVDCPAPHCERVATTNDFVVSESPWTTVEIVCPDGHRYSTQLSSPANPGGQPEIRFGLKVA
jgi:hypothetical protein